MSSRRFAQWLAAAVLPFLCLPTISIALEVAGPPAPAKQGETVAKASTLTQLPDANGPVGVAAASPAAQKRESAPPAPLPTAVVAAPAVQKAGTIPAAAPVAGASVGDANGPAESSSAAASSLQSPELAGDGEEILLTPEPYYYESLGRRDLFVSLISEEYEKENPSPRPVSDELRVVGILWAEKDRFALLETEDGRSLILREGGTLGDGEVAQILPDRVVIRVTEYGSLRTKSLPLMQGGGWNENPRSRNR